MNVKTATGIVAKGDMRTGNTYGCIGIFQPNATSRIIITEKPNIVAIVTISMCA
jgi:hypothetical protein